MTIIKDEETNRAYKLVANTLFYAPLYDDNSIDEERWVEVRAESPSYHDDIIKKLKSMNLIISGMYKGICDDL